MDILEHAPIENGEHRKKVNKYYCNEHIVLLLGLHVHAGNTINLIFFSVKMNLLEIDHCGFSFRFNQTTLDF